MSFIWVSYEFLMSIIWNSGWVSEWDLELHFLKFRIAFLKFRIAYAKCIIGLLKFRIAFHECRMHFPNAESECFVFLCIPKTRIPPIKDVSRTASLLAVKNVSSYIAHWSKVIAWLGPKIRHHFAEFLVLKARNL